MKHNGITVLDKLNVRTQHHTQHHTQQQVELVISFMNSNKLNVHIQHQVK